MAHVQLSDLGGCELGWSPTLVGWLPPEPQQLTVCNTFQTNSNKYSKISKTRGKLGNITKLPITHRL